MAEKITSTNLRIPTALWQKLRVLAVKTGTSANKLVVKVLAAYLKGDKA